MRTLQEDLRLRRAQDDAAASYLINQNRPLVLIVSIWAGPSWVLPWTQFVRARVEGEQLELSFGTCVVTVTGSNLQGLLEDVAAFRISVLRDLPTEFRPQVVAGQPTITGIEVSPASGSGGSAVREAPA